MGEEEDLEEMEDLRELGWGAGAAGQLASLRIPYIPRMMATPESLFPTGDELDSSQLQMESDEVDTLREGEDPGTQGIWMALREERRGEPGGWGLWGSTLLDFLSSQPTGCTHFWPSMSFSL